MKNKSKFALPYPVAFLPNNNQLVPVVRARHQPRIRLHGSKLRFSPASSTDVLSQSRLRHTPPHLL
jgi:hypothetical protein